MRDIIEQCAEWQRSIYIDVIDFIKVFDSVHRGTLWKILIAYGIPDSDIMFEVKTGVRQRCVLSTLLFNFVIDWILSRTIEDKKRGIRWKLSTALEDFDHADDLAFVSHAHPDMQEKTNRPNHLPPRQDYVSTIPKQN